MNDPPHVLLTVMCCYHVCNVTYARCGQTTTRHNMLALASERMHKKVCKPTHSRPGQEGPDWHDFARPWCSLTTQPTVLNMKLLLYITAAPLKAMPRLAPPIRVQRIATPSPIHCDQRRHGTKVSTTSTHRTIHHHWRLYM